MGLIEYFGNHIALLDYGEADTLTGLASRKTFRQTPCSNCSARPPADELLGGSNESLQAALRRRDRVDTEQSLAGRLRHRPFQAGQ